MSRSSRIIIANAYEAERAAHETRAQQIMWTRQELSEIMRAYGRAVTDGLWRDYGISTTQDRAIFAVFRKSQEAPLYRLEKIPSLRQKQGQYQLIAFSGQILKRGHDLAAVLKGLESRKLKRIK
jgi:hypothetical protein